MPYKEYCVLEHETPYIFHIQKKGQHLFYFGATHTFDSKDPLYKKIVTSWKDFLRLTYKDNCIVLIEGGERIVAKTKEQAIRDDGEMGYVTYLANEEDIKTLSPEPPPQYRYNKLLEEFSKKEIAYYDFVLTCHQWNRYKEKPDFEEYATRFLESDRRKSGWKRFDFSLKNMLKIHAEIFGTTFNKNDKRFFSDILNPLSSKSVINKISLFEDSGLRDEYIVAEIEKYWKRGMNIFIIYGVSHAVRQEPVIRDFVFAS